MTTIRRIMVLAVVLAGAALLPVAEAQPTRAETRSEATQSYPRTYGSGENIMVDYGPMGQGMLVGGGRVAVSQTAGMDIEIMHLDAQFAQQPRQGFVPLDHRLGRDAGDGLGAGRDGGHDPPRPRDVALT